MISSKIVVLAERSKPTTTNTINCKIDSMDISRSLKGRKIPSKNTENAGRIGVALVCHK